MKNLLNQLLPPATRYLNSLLIALLISGVSVCNAQKTEAEIKQDNKKAEVKEFLDNWTPYIPEMSKGKVTYGVSTVAHSGAVSATINVASNAPANFYQFFRDVKNVKPGEFYEFSMWIKTENVANGVGAFMGIGALDPNPPFDRMFSSDSERVTKNTDWTRVTAPILVPEGVHSLRMIILLNGTGQAWYDDIQLKKLDTFQDIKKGELISVNVTDKITTKQFIGFGYEDDAFFFNDENQLTNGAQYISPEDLKLRADRIEELAPSVIATLFWWDAISPSHDINKITYDTRKMRDLVKTLEVHQKAGAKVFMGDVHWGWDKNNFTYNDKNVEKGAKAYADLIKYLVKDKGLNCIEFVCVSGEVDMVFEKLGGSFDTYLKAVRILRKELDKAGLQNVKIIGDKSGGFVWLDEIVPILDDQFDIFTIHEYPEPTQVSVVDYRMKRTLDIVKRHSKPIGKDENGLVYKPTFLYEIGANKAGDGGAASAMSPTYDYGLLCANTAILGLNNGIVGGSVWCLHSMYYPGYNMMNYGVWEFKDNNWKIRPVFYGYGLFSKFARPGMQPLGVVTKPLCYNLTAGALKSKSGEYIFYAVNLSSKNTTLKISGLPDGKYDVYEYSENRLPKMNDKLYGKINALKTDQIWSPEMKTIPIQKKSILMLKKK